MNRWTPIAYRWTSTREIINSLLKEGYLKDHAQTIAGGITSNDISWLNNLISKSIDNAEKCTIHIVVGNKERRYSHHVIPFTEEIKANHNISVEMQIESFEEHSFIAKVFPNYAKNKIKDILEKNY